MTLPASGEITLNDVNVELGNTGTDAITIGSADVRDLFGVASGEITMADGYGKSSVYEIANSLRFDKNSNAKLARTPSSAGNRKTWTWSCWVKRGAKIGSYEWLFSANNSCKIGFNGDNQLNAYTGSELRPTQVFRDPSAWFHILWVMDTTQGSASNREKIYINGEQVTDFASTGRPSQNANTDMNNTVGHHIGWSGSSSYPEYNDGYKADMYLIDGTACSPSDFGETGDYGEWKPKSYSGSYGTNGFYLDFASSGSLGNDANGSNNWSTTSVSSTDQVKDSPTNNFCTLNPIARVANNTSADLSEGNLKIVASNYFSYGTMAVSTGKWYFEAYVGSSNGGSIGITRTDVNHHDGGFYYDPGWFKEGWGYYKDGRKYRDTSYITYGNSFTTGDIVGCAVDLDNAKVWFSKNGTWQASGNPVSGTNYAWNNVTYEVTPKLGTHQGSGSYEVANFGQDSSFAGNKTAQGNQDSNGIGDFYYTPPTDFLALCTSNLPDPAVIPSENFNSVIWSGDSDTSRLITGIGFQPDWTWIKQRNGSCDPRMMDAVRGATRTLRPHQRNHEANDSQMLSFESDGYELGNDTCVNYSGRTFVSWNWKANGSGSTNTNGSVNSTVSANQDAGFSIVGHTGTGSTLTVGHGLSKAPEFIINKNRDQTSNSPNDGNWRSYHIGLNSTAPEDYFIKLNDTTGATNHFTTFNDTAPTATVFTLGAEWEINQNNQKIISYCFHSVDGYSKCGKYVGNGSADGTFVYTGFRVAYVLIKSATSAQDWEIHDAGRNPYNEVNARLEANLSSSEETAYNKCDFLANGFKLRNSTDSSNQGSQTFIYLAFADQPFKHSNAR